MAKHAVRLRYYLDVLSSWCLIAEDAFARVRNEFGDEVYIDWRIAALRESFGYTPEQLAWYYRRTASITGVQLNAVWLQSTNDGSKWANRVAEAARLLGVEDDRVRLALARAAMVEGRRSCDRDVAVTTAAAASKLDPARLNAAVDDPAVSARIEESSNEFASFGVTVRPAFVVRNAVGDISVLSGCWRYEPLKACIRAALDDQAGYVLFGADHPAPAGAV